jgi:DNA-directed RNA polymerase specialized sigma24 family protein
MVAGRRVAGFTTTSWTLIRAAGEAGGTEALAELCQRYWPPVYAFIRGRGHDADSARDLTQGFFAALLERRWLAAPDEQRGTFRSFLLTSVKHFLANEWDRAHAVKRGGRETVLSIDTVDAEAWQRSLPVEQWTPERLFERRWAVSLLEHVMGLLRREFVEAGRAEDFERMAPFLRRETDGVRYEQVARELGTTPGAVRMGVHRMRRRYRELLRREIEATVSSNEDVDEELRFLFAALAD